MRHLAFAAALSLAAALPTRPAAGEEAEERIRNLEGNSFLVEEAYNMEEGRVAHTATWARDRSTGAWMGSLAQDWAVGSEAHQLGYAVCFGRQGAAAGLGDVTFNYRYQLIDDERVLTSAPRLSLLLPAGDPRRGLGAGGLGLAANLPVSLRVADWLAAHSNVGGSLTPAGRDGAGQPTRAWALALGQSVVLAPSRFANLLVEAQWVRGEVVAAGQARRADALLLSPGLRAGLDVGTVKAVFGIAAPIGLGPSRGQVSVIGYFSLDTPFREPRARAPLPRVESPAPQGEAVASASP
jgi:hypothetical protein